MYMERMGYALLRHFLLLATLAATTGPACAQSQETQVWTDFTVGRNFASIYMAEVEFGYQALVQGDPQWRTFSISPTLDFRTLTSH